MSNSLEPNQREERAKAIWQEFGGLLAHTGPLPEKCQAYFMLAITCARQAVSLGDNYLRFIEFSKGTPDTLADQFLEILKAEAENLEAIISNYEPGCLELPSMIAGCRNGPFSLGNKYWKANQFTAHRTAIVLARLIIHVARRGSRGDPSEIPVLAREDLGTLENEIVWEARGLAAKSKTLNPSQATREQILARLDLEERHLLEAVDRGCLFVPPVKDAKEFARVLTSENLAPLPDLERIWFAIRRLNPEGLPPYQEDPKTAPEAMQSIEAFRELLVSPKVGEVPPPSKTNGPIVRSGAAEEWHRREKHQAVALDGTALAVFGIIKAQRGKGKSGKELVKALAKQEITISELYFRRHIVSQLKDHGVLNHRARGGYYLP
jgi:hypothetical protein